MDQFQLTEETATETRPGAVPDLPRRSNRNGIAICLSGGGFRASLFHMGVLRRLHEAGVLAKVKTISSVSGGSIFAGHLAAVMIERGYGNASQIVDWEIEVAQGFRAIAGRDLRTWPVVAHLLWNWLLPDLRSRHMESRYRDRITASSLAELPNTPRFVFCATDLSFGVNWEFSRERAGDYLAGYVKAPQYWSIAKAIAASASFPPLIGPMTLRLKPGELNGGNYRGGKGDRLRRRIDLTDGGVYDNMALEPVWKTHECVLVSDCGAPFGFSIARNYLTRAMRYNSVIMNQAQATRKRAYFQAIDDRSKEPIYDGGYWGLGGSVEEYVGNSGISVPGYSATLVDDLIARVRTDLDRFTAAEMNVLENHGYLLAAAVLARRRPELIDPGTRRPAPPHPDWLDEKRVRTALHSSHARVSMARLFGNAPK